MAIDPITAGLEIGGKLIDRIWPDPTQAAQAKLELAKMQQSGELASLVAETELAKGQLEIDKVEASSASLFVAGWRPFIGWVCGVALCYHFILQPLLSWIASALGHTVILPVFDMDSLHTILMGMLGLGAMRTAEKIKGVAKS